MEREKNFEQGGFTKAELNIEEPERDKNFMISFDAKDENQKNVYQQAINEVCDTHKLRPFHQSGSHNDSGYQAFELWSEVSREILDDLVPEIHQRAEDIYNDLKNLGLT